MRVRYRVDGILRDAMELPKSAQLPAISRIKVMAGMKIDQKLAPQGGRIGMRLGRHAYDFRVSTLPNQYGEKVVMRVLDKATINVDLGKLGFSSQTQEAFERLIMRPARDCPGYGSHRLREIDNQLRGAEPHQYDG